jgi:disulfide oxidoreductase YuzD
MEEQTKVAEFELKNKFGEQIEVEYVDIYSPSRIETVQNVMLLVMSGQAALPVTVIDGEPKIGGAISVPMITKELESLGAKQKKSSR